MRIHGLEALSVVKDIIAFGTSLFAPYLTGICLAFCHNGLEDLADLLWLPKP